tara:strand:- start:1785 stop:2651 length:867 start_codon:yes stop_codon:yes gene_type:complete
MALTTATERADSWQHIITADGNEEFTLRFYAPWDEAYGVRAGEGGRFAELGDPLETASGVVDKRLRLTRITASPTMGDKEGCLYEQVYTSNNNTLQAKQPNLRSSWRASFSTVLEVKDVINEIAISDAGSDIDDYTGTALTVKDADGKVIPKTVYVPRTVYNVSFSIDEINLSLYHNAIGKINSDRFFTQTRKINSGDSRIKDAEGRWVYKNIDGTADDKFLWLFWDFAATETGINNYEVSMQFKYNPAGWNAPKGGSPEFYVLVRFQPLFAAVKDLFRPPSTIPGRT